MYTTCENCDGEGGWEITFGDGYSEESRWQVCPQCNGSGRVYGEGEPITIDDLSPPIGDCIL